MNDLEDVVMVNVMIKRNAYIFSSLFILQVILESEEKLAPLFMSRVQLLYDCRATTRRKLTFKLYSRKHD